MPTLARYPLAPGRPRVYQRRPGRWAYECHCAPHGRRRTISSAMPNLDTHHEALQQALNHIRRDHVHDWLELLFLLPAAPTAALEGR